MDKEKLLLIFILALALIVRITWVLNTKVIPDISDEATYNGMALDWLDGKSLLPEEKGDYYSWTKPPGYPIFIALVYQIFGRNNFLAVFIVQTLLNVVTVLLIYLLGKRLFDKRTGIIAAVMAALYIDFILYNITLFSEILAVFLIMLAVWCLLCTSPLIGLIGGGIFVGIATLTRGAVLFFLPGVVLAILIAAKGGFRNKVSAILVFLFAFTLTLFPYWVASGGIRGFGPGAYNFYNANNINATGGWVFTSPIPKNGKTNKEMEKIFLIGGIRFIKEHPLFYGRLALIKISRFFTADRDYIFDHLIVPNEKSNQIYHVNYFRGKQGLSSEERLPQPRWLALFSHLPNLLILFFSLLGIILAFGNKNNETLLLLLCSYIFGLAFFSIVYVRFRLLTMPFFMLYAAYGLSSTKHIIKDPILYKKKIFIFVISAIVLIGNYVYTLSGFLRRILE